MTITKLAEIMKKHKVSFRELELLTEESIKTLDSMTAEKLEELIAEGICPDGYHYEGIGEHPFGFDCGECGESTCKNCPHWTDDTYICEIFKIKYKCNNCTSVYKHLCSRKE